MLASLQLPIPVVHSASDPTEKKVIESRDQGRRTTALKPFNPSKLKYSMCSQVMTGCEERRWKWKMEIKRMEWSLGGLEDKSNTSGGEENRARGAGGRRGEFSPAVADLPDCGGCDWP